MPVKVIAVGNPGAGKSSFGNCLLGRVGFHADASDTGGGVTTSMSEASNSKYRYVDVPGLADADPQLRERAAREVTRALREDTDSKILFFVRTVQGRILSEDKVLMVRVAEALGSNLQENRYGVVINQFKKKAYQAVTENPEKRREWLAKLWVGMAPDGSPMTRTTYVVFNPEDEEMDGEANVVKALPGHVVQFVDTFPAVAMKSADVQEINTTNFDAAVERQREVDKSNLWKDILEVVIDAGRAFLPLAGPGGALAAGALTNFAAAQQQRGSGSGARRSQ